MTPIIVKGLSRSFCFKNMSWYALSTDVAPPNPVPQNIPALS